MLDATVKGVNPVIDNLSKEIINHQKREFICMLLGKNPKIPDNPKWINIDEALQIYRNLLDVCGVFHIVSQQDLNYALSKPLMDIAGVPIKSVFTRICECAYGIYHCASETVAAQYSATIFILLCKLNNVNIKFEIGDIADIFPRIKHYSISCAEFEKIMMEHIVR
jgi:hypothetical protein